MDKSKKIKVKVRFAMVMMTVIAAGLGLLFASRLPLGAQAQQDDRKLQIDDRAARQIEALIREKESRTPAQQKIDSQLLYKMHQDRGDEFAKELEDLRPAVQLDPSGRVLVDISARVTPALLGMIRGQGGEVSSAFEKFDAVRANVPLESLEAIAALDEVKFIRPAEEPDFSGNTEVKRQVPFVPRAVRAEGVRARLAAVIPIIAARKNRENATSWTSFSRFGRRNFLAPFIGAQDTEGDVAHRADQVRTLGIDGTGVRIGVLSDSVRFLAQSQMSGDLPATVTVVPGQDGIDTVNTPPNDTGEGTAMLEIVHDLAPQAQLFFATAFGGQGNMANNIVTLAGAPFDCDIIVDDVSYFSAGVFQDGTVAQAVNTVTAAGVLYFSSAGNSGNLNDGTSGVWEGDFVDGGTLALTPGGRVHDFGGNTISNQILQTGGGTRPINLKWSDPLGASNNDYDLFILNGSLTAVVASSTNTQNGSQDPLESISNNAMTPVFAAGQRIVVLQRTGAAVRALHLNSNRGRLGIGTAGQTYGHNAAGAAITVAAVPAATAGGGVFAGGAANPVETFSSDGPRRIFYTAAGNAITPGNVLFGSNGGTALQKPDIAAADCVTTTVPGFANFCGTSAAAPHAAAIAALLLSFDNTLTPAQIRTALTSTALDIEAPGLDRDSGSGIVMALPAISSVSSADLAITKTDSPDPVVAGTNLTYTINVTNNGTGPAAFIQVSDNLSAGTTFHSLMQSSGWNCSTPGVGSGGAVSCTKDTMDVSEAASFTIVVRVDAGLPNGSVINNTATVSSSTSDPNPGNNSSSTTTGVIAQADLEVVSMTDSPDPVVTNNTLTYTITIRNNGPSVAVNSTLTDILPFGAIFDNCGSTGGGVCGGSGQNRMVDFAGLGAGAMATVTLLTTANCSLAGGSLIINSATITSATTDPNPTNNSSSTTTTAENPPPVITCPQDQDVIALTPGSMSAIVNYPMPTVVDNCPGAIVVCSVPSGSSFPLGTTTVNCTATDSGGATDSCSFNVTVWDASIQDDSLSDYILFNTFTGDYKFVHCGIDGFTMIGQGKIYREGCVTTLKDDTRVNVASFNRCHIAPLNTGYAKIKRWQPDTTFVLQDRNILNNSPTCP